MATERVRSTSSYTHVRRLACCVGCTPVASTLRPNHQRVREQRSRGEVRERFHGVVSPHAVPTETPSQFARRIIAAARSAIEAHSLHVIAIQNRRCSYIAHFQPDFTLPDLTSSPMANWTKLLHKRFLERSRNRKSSKCQTRVVPLRNNPPPPQAILARQLKKRTDGTLNALLTLSLPARFFVRSLFLRFFPVSGNS